MRADEEGVWRPFGRAGELRRNARPWACLPLDYVGALYWFTQALARLGFLAYNCRNLSVEEDDGPGRGVV